MAWGQCKLEAVALIQKKTEELGSVRAACQAVSEECDIPANTLRDWSKYPDGRPKAGAGEESPGTTPMSETTGGGRNDEPTPQSVVWSNVERRFALLRKYMDTNCLLPANMDPLVRDQIYGHVDALNQWRDEDAAAHEQN